MQFSNGTISTEIKVNAPTQKPQRRRFSAAEKLRIVREADGLAAGTIGAFLRRKGIYSSQLYAWRHQRDQGELDSGAVRQRAKARMQADKAAQRIKELERETRKLCRQLARAELISEIPKCGAPGDRPEEPRDERERRMSAALDLARELPERTLCEAAGISRSTLRRRLHGTPQRPPSTLPRRPSRRALGEPERAEVLKRMHRERFADRAPATIHATLLDEGVYLCSVSTMYRLLRLNEEVRERRRIARHPEYRKPELVATGPRQVLSWDITKLRGPRPSEWFSLLVMLDIFSRFVVEWMLVRRANAELAKHFIAHTLQREGIQPGQAIVHADRGTEMTAQPVVALLDKLCVGRSHSRPHVSDDNPFSESQFRTMKYHPEFPDRFASFEHAYDFMDVFTPWYRRWLRGKRIISHRLFRLVRLRVAFRAVSLRPRKSADACGQMREDRGFLGCIRPHPRREILIPTSR